MSIPRTEKSFKEAFLNIVINVLLLEKSFQKSRSRRVVPEVEVQLLREVELLSLNFLALLNHNSL
jgi:hypothetical protein